MEVGVSVCGFLIKGGFDSLGGEMDQDVQEVYVVSGIFTLEFNRAMYLVNFLEEFQ